MPTVQISILPDLTPVDAYDGNSCPMATRDPDVNADNKAGAIDEANYGEAVLASEVCGNCRHYDQTEDTLNCIGDDSGELGYCLMYRFVCASDHSCDNWAEGGPMTDSPQQSYRDNL